MLSLRRALKSRLPNYFFLVSIACMQVLWSPFLVYTHIARYAIIIIIIKGTTTGIRLRSAFVRSSQFYARTANSISYAIPVLLTPSLHMSKVCHVLFFYRRY